MTLRETVTVIAIINILLFVLAYWISVLYLVQGLVSCITIIILVFWIGDLEKEVNKKEQA
jgi:uncharacterized membrane protein YccF (DUF307 family)